MRVRYFPQTHVSDALAEVLKRLFDEVAVIAAADDDPVPEGLTALRPTPEESKRLRDLLADWRRFSGLHQEGVATYALGLERRVDPLDDQLTSQIKSELMRQVKGGAAPDEGTDSRAVARALLSLAAEHDLRSRDLTRELARIDRMQSELLDSLKGEVPDLPEPSEAAGYPEGAQMLKRLSAWATLFVGEAEPCPDRVFVTTSREALALVEEFGAPLQELGVVPGETLSGELLEKLLAGDPLEVMAAEGDLKGDDPVMVRIFIARSEHPYKVFNGFIHGADVCRAEYQGQPADIVGDVLFVLLEGIATD